MATCFFGNIQPISLAQIFNVYTPNKGMETPSVEQPRREPTEPIEAVTLVDDNGPLHSSPSAKKPKSVRSLKLDPMVEQRKREREARAAEKRRQAEEKRIARELKIEDRRQKKEREKAEAAERRRVREETAAAKRRRIEEEETKKVRKAEREERQRREKDAFRAYFKTTKRQATGAVPRTLPTSWRKLKEEERAKEIVDSAPLLHRPQLDPDLTVLASSPSFKDVSTSDYIASIKGKKLQFAERKPDRAKLFQFSENHRPPYFGTWHRRSAAVRRGRRPFACDFSIDYEEDSDWEVGSSDAEWLASDISGDSDDEDDDLEETPEDKDFVVPHAYLSDGEGEEMGAEKDDFRAARLVAREREFERSLAQKKARFAHPLEPVVLGPFFDDKDDDRGHSVFRLEAVQFDK